jgi:uncharacterized protein (TIGR02996 family)
MDHEQAFLKAISEEPQDNTHRLVFADWLEERGRPGDADRALFIRTQIALAGKRWLTREEPLMDNSAALGTLTPKQWLPLQEREHKLLKQHRSEWLRTLRAVVPSLRDNEVAFARGFPDAVFFHCVEDLGHAGELAAIAPLQAMGFYRPNSNMGYEELQALVDSPQLHHLTRLDLSHNPIGNGWVESLADLPQLRNLTHLNLNFSSIGAEGVRALAASPQLHHLTHLNLVMRRRCKPFRDSGLTTDTHARIVCLGCYAGEVYLRFAKGHWLGLEKDHTRSANDLFDLGIAIEFTGVIAEYIKEPIRPVAKAFQRFHGKASYTNSLEFLARFIDAVGCESEKLSISKIARGRDHSG